MVGPCGQAVSAEDRLVLVVGPVLILLEGQASWLISVDLTHGFSNVFLSLAAVYNSLGADGFK